MLRWDLSDSSMFRGERMDSFCNGAGLKAGNGQKILAVTERKILAVTRFRLRKTINYTDWKNDA